MAVLSAAAECHVTGKNKDRKYTAVKLKIVSTNVGLPKKK